MRISDWSSDVCSSDLFGRGDDKCVERGSIGYGGVESLGHFARTECAGGNPVADRLDTKIGKLGHHSITLGTPKKPCSAAGALASTASRLPPPVRDRKGVV